MILLLLLESFVWGQMASVGIVSTMIAASDMLVLPALDERTMTVARTACHLADTSFESWSLLG